MDARAHRIFEDDRIDIVDHDNAGERRGLDTLSGGETFRASLALALALSSQAQQIAGVVYLNVCLLVRYQFEKENGKKSLGGQRDAPCCSEVSSSRTTRP
jgi:hypothetical protein